MIAVVIRSIASVVSMAVVVPGAIRARRSDFIVFATTGVGVGGHSEGL